MAWSSKQASVDTQADTGNDPEHVAIVMDGNGRWARDRNLPRQVGHRHGRRSVRAVIEVAVARNIPVLTLFAFSSENWRRPAQEVSALMKLFSSALKRELSELVENNIRLRFIGDTKRFDADIQKLMHAAQTRTAANTGLLLQIAVSYGGQWDILQAAAKLHERDDLDWTDSAQLHRAFEQSLSTADAPPVDLFIRTGGEQRLSNFMLWQSAYAELYFTDTYWPGFDHQAFEQALAWFRQRQRRFGQIEPATSSHKHA